MAASAWIRVSDCKDVRIQEGPGREGGTRWPTEAAEPAAVEPSGSAGAGEAAPARQSSADPHPADVDVDVGALVGEKTEDDVGAEAMVQDQGCYHGWPTYFRYKRCDGWCDRVTTDLACVRPCNERLDHFLDHHPGPHLCTECGAGEQILPPASHEEHYEKNGLHHGWKGVGSCCPDPKQPGPCVSRSQFLCFDPKRWLN
jgi:hypothetical protein